MEPGLATESHGEDQLRARAMESDVDPGALSRLQGGTGAAEGRTTSWYPQGSETLEGVMDWPSALVDSLMRDREWERCLQNLKHVLVTVGVQVNTDYSGMGGVEMSLTMLLQRLQEHFHRDAKVLFWRACDLLPHCQDTLSAPGASQPEHVFGDLLDRIPAAVRKQMEKAHSNAERQFRAKVGRGMPEQKASEVVGKAFLNQLVELAQTAHFSKDATAWCYKHQRRCRVHGPKDARQPQQPSACAA